MENLLFSRWILNIDIFFAVDDGLFCTFWYYFVIVKNVLFKMLHYTGKSSILFMAFHYYTIIYKM